MFRTSSFARGKRERKKEKEKKSAEDKISVCLSLSFLDVAKLVPVTPFCAYAKLPAAVAPVTAATVVPTISFALNPSRDSAGTNTTAPPKPVIADTAPAKEPDAAENAARDAGVDNDSTAAFAAILVSFASLSSL